MPNLVIMCSRMKLATAAPVALRRGIASTHFVKYSVATRIQMYPPDDGLIGPMRSSPQGGFAFPLVDPWYTSSPLFPPRSVDFSFPAEDWDWTSSGLEPSVDQAWVPNLDEISELLIQKGDLQAVPINFDFLCACSKEWSHWVDREVLDPDFWDRLVDAGLTPTLEDVANHWMLPILGEHSFSDIKLSAEEEEVAAALRKRASTRLSGWPAHFSQVDEAAVRRAAFDIVFPLHHYSWATFTRNWTCSMIARFKATLATFCLLSLTLQYCKHFSGSTRSVILPIARDRSAAWGRFSDLPREFLEQFPDFRANLPLVYRWVGLKTHDHDLVDALDYEENVLFRPYGEDYPADDYRSLSYLSTVNPGFLPVLSATGVYFIPYCPQRVQRQFGLDQGVPVGPQETGTCIADLAAFLKSRAFVRWGGETTRVFIPGGHRLGFNTPSMGAYWQRFSQSMVDLVITGRSATTPMSVHRKASVSNPYLAPPSQSAISYANSQKLGFAEWDASRGGWIAYTIHLPEGWRNSVTIVEDPPHNGFKTWSLRQPMRKNQLSLPLPLLKERQGQGKRGKSLPLVPSAAEGSTAVPLEEPSEYTESPPEKARVGKKSKSTVPEASAVKESATASVKGPTESTAAPSKPKSASAGSSQQSSKRIAASRPPKSQKKVDVSSSSPDEEEPSAVPGPSPPQKKKFTAPLFPLGAAGRTRSKSGPKVTHESGRSSGGVVDIEDSDVADDDVIASPVRKDAPQAAAVDQDEDLGKSTAGSSEGCTPGSLPEDQIVSAGSTADDDTMSEADDSMPWTLMQTPSPFRCRRQFLTRAGFDISMAHVMEGVSLFGVTPSLRAIPAGGFVIPASRLSSEGSPVAGGALVPERTPAQSLIESGSVVDLGVDTVSHDAPIEDAGTSAVDASAGSDHLENIDLGIVFHRLGYRLMKCLLGYPYGWKFLFLLVVLENCSVDGKVFPWLSSYGKVCSMDLVVVLWKILFWTWLSSYGKVFPFGYHSWLSSYGCNVLGSMEDFLMDLVVVAPWRISGLLGVDDTVHVLEDVGEIGTAGEVTAISPPPRPTNEAGPSVDVGSLSSEVAAFLREFDARAPNPHPEQFFCDFTKGFKLSIGLGGPMMSLLGSVLAAMDESSLEDVTKTQILAWRSVIQDLMDVGFDLGFMMKRLRQMAQHLFGKRLADEIKALQHQIALLQDSLAELTAYQAVMTSTEGVVPRPERGGSLLDSLLD
uniref:Aminotransferase-like plant mobile domain-containing protein n=1 Tax=Fagus sylvatica TaxID=28930 RepID=A0A2N9FKG6_FAGSY